MGIIFFVESKVKTETVSAVPKQLRGRGFNASVFLVFNKSQLSPSRKASKVAKLHWLRELNVKESLSRHSFLLKNVGYSTN